MTTKGISLQQGTVVVLTLDGTMVYVEEVTRSYVAVVALPEQPAERSDDRVFTPGRVGQKKISPFAQADKVVEIIDLSDRNKNFIGDFEKLRAEHGPNYVDLTEAERAAMTVTKAGPKPKVDRTAEKEAKKAEREEAKKKRQEERAAAKQASAAPVTCAACDAGHHLTDTGLHYEGADETGKLLGVCAKLMAKIKGRAPKSAAAKVPGTPRTPKAPSGKATELKYSLRQDLLDNPATDEVALKDAILQKDKFKDGNRGHKVYRGLLAAGSPATVAQVMEKVAEAHGADWCSDPEGIVGRALKELSKPDFGGVTVLVK